VNRFVSAHDFTGCGRKAGAPRPWCWGRGNRAQRAAFSCVSGHDLQSFRQRSTAPRQGSPHSKKLNLKLCAFVELNSGPQLLSTVSETKTGRHPCSAPPLQTGPRLQGSTSSRAENDQTTLQLAEKSPRSAPPGSPHSKKLSLKPCAVVELNSGPQLLSTVSETKTGPHPCPAPPWQTGFRLQGSTSSRAENDQTVLQLAEKSPRPTRQGSPHSKKLNLTPRAVVQLNSGPQLLSTVSETKTGPHPCPAPPWQTGFRLQGSTSSRAENDQTVLQLAEKSPRSTPPGSPHSTVSETKTGRHPCSAPPLRTGPTLQDTTSSRAENDQTALQLAEKSPRSTPPGSPHSKKLSLKPCAVVELNSGPQLLSTVSEPKRDAARAPLRFGKLAPGASARLDLACSERSAATGAPDTPVVGVTGWQRARFWHDGVEKARSRMGAENDQIRFGALAPEG
jgi:hypothetical protein